MTCMTCADLDFDDTVGCIGGTIYGPCAHYNCGGLCEAIGDCDCDCHTRKQTCVDPDVG